VTSVGFFKNFVKFDGVSERPIFVEIVCPNQIFIASSAAPLSCKYLSKLVGNTASYLLVKKVLGYVLDVLFNCFGTRFAHSLSSCKKSKERESRGAGAELHSM
jgi:putative Ca2+/H+ antiporter (TMEM165/GDT1 family)